MNSKRIYVNGNIVVTDDDTKIGTISRDFDFTDPGNRKQVYTNNISLPISGNEVTFEFCHEAGYTGTLPYDRLNVQIFVDGYNIIKNGIGYIADITEDRYILNVREQPDWIQAMKDTLLSDLTVPSVSLGLDTTGVIAAALLNATSAIKLDFIFDEAQREYSYANPTTYRKLIEYGYFTYYIKTVMSLIATEVGITFAGSLLTDSYYTNMRMIISGANIYGAAVNTGNATIYAQGIILNREKTCFDLFKAVLQMFGAVYSVDGTTVTLEKIDSKSVTKVSWSGKVQKRKSKKFSIENVSQVNYMRMKQGGDASEQLNQSKWTCSNKNILSEGVLIEPDITVFPFIGLQDIITGVAETDKAIYLPKADISCILGYYTSVTSFSINNTIDDFVFLVDGDIDLPLGTIVEVQYVKRSGVYPTYTYTKLINSRTTVSGDNMTVATYYNSQNDYDIFASMIDKPVVYEVEIDLNILDLVNYNPYELKTIPELGGDFYVNSLQYNFDDNGKGSKAVLIKY